jgi:hypothetical protein
MKTAKGSLMGYIFIEIKIVLLYHNYLKKGASF